MKFLHTSDWHLGIGSLGRVSFVNDQRFALNEIVKIAKKEKVDAILIAGDVFDKSIASSEAIMLYDEIVTKICADLNIPVYIIAGNHDGAARLSQCNELLKKSGLFVAGALEREPIFYEKGDACVYLLPWISTDKVKTVFPEKKDEIDSMEKAYEVVLESYRNSFKKDKKHILVSHAFIVDCETSTSDKSAEIGHATMVSAKVFDGFDYVALGHLHGPQNVNDRIRYSGTPMAYSFGKEEKQEKSVTIFDTNSSEKKIVPVKQLRKRITLTDTFSVIMDTDFEDDIKNAYLRLEITDKYVGLNEYTAFLEKFPNMLELSCKSLERDDAKITMTIEDYEKLHDNPLKIFEKYCEDIMGTTLDEHRISLFEEALSIVEKG